MATSNTGSNFTSLDHIPNRISRNRPQLSCMACRRRKLKCDRRKPCDNCIRRNEESLCTYLAFNLAGRHLKERREPRAIRSRLDQLESLVSGLIDAAKQPNSNPSEGDRFGRGSAVSVAAQQCGNILHSGTEDNAHRSHASIESSSLWEDVLNDLTEIRNYVDHHELRMESQTTGSDIQRPSSPNMAPLFCSGGHTDIRIFIASLPSRAETDRLVANFFRLSYIMRPIVHPKKFQREYEAYWADPYAVSVSWLSLLFSMLRIATGFFMRSGEALLPSLVDGPAAVAGFRSRALECLSSTGFHKISPYTLEAFLLHIEAEFMESPDSRIDTWILTSTVVRIALRCGLHHDPLGYKGISACEAELRRRLWLGIVQCDIMMSFQVGLPAMIPKQQVDVHLPRNLREDDFDEDSPILPSSRSMAETTNIAFFLAKQPLLETFAQVVAYSQEACPKDEDVAVLQAELDRSRDQLPPLYRLRPLHETLTEPSVLVLQRYAIDQIYQTGVCVLHRRHLIRALSDPNWSSSRRICVDAALTLLNYQSIKYEEMKPTGRFAGDKFMMNSLDQNSFLLAAMLISLDLNNRGGMCLESSDISLWKLDRADEMWRALKTSVSIWNSLRETSFEASRASQALSTILRQLNDGNSKYELPAVNTNAGEDILHLDETFSLSSDINWLDFDRIFADQERN